MVYNLYSMFDKVAKVYQVPVAIGNDDVLKRSVVSAISNPKSEIRSIKNDLEWYKIGQYDDVTSKITTCDKELIITGLQIEVENNG